MINCCNLYFLFFFFKLKCVCAQVSSGWVWSDSGEAGLVWSLTPEQLLFWFRDKPKLDQSAVRKKSHDLTLHRLKLQFFWFRVTLFKLKEQTRGRSLETRFSNVPVDSDTFICSYVKTVKVSETTWNVSSSWVFNLILSVRLKKSSTVLKLIHLHINVCFSVTLWRNHVT